MQTGNNPTSQNRHYRPHPGEARPLNITGRWRRNDLTTPGSNPGDVITLPTAGKLRIYGMNRSKVMNRRLGDFSNVTWNEMPSFAIASTIGIAFALLQIKPLNALLLGENYASNLGVNVKRARYSILLAAGLLIAAVTAFCGPISFIGLAVPHVARMLLGTSNHKTLLPATILLGSVVALLCNLLTTLPGEGGIIPINAVTSMLGAPVVIYVIFNRRKLQYFS